LASTDIIIFRKVVVEGWKNSCYLFWFVSYFGVGW